MDQDPTLPPFEGAPSRPDVVAPDGTAATSVSPPRRRWVPIVLAAVGVTLVGVGAAAFLLLRGSDEVLFDQVPSSADVVMAAYLDPAASQKVNLFRMAERFPELGSRDEVMSEMDDLLDEALAEAGLTHEDLGWVGVEVALWVDIPSEEEVVGAILVDSDDDAGAQAALDRVVAFMRDRGDDVTSSTHDGVEVWSTPDGGALAYADHTMILASDPAAAEATIDVGRGSGEPIDGSQAFQDALGGLPEARLAVAYVGIEGITGALEQSLNAAGAGDEPLELAGAQAVAMSVAATDDGMAIDVSQVTDPDELPPELAAELDEAPHDNAALAMIPNEAFGVLALEHMDVYLQEGLAALEEQEPSVGEDLDELEITGGGGLVENLTGDIAIEAAPSSGDPVAGAILLGVEDAARMESWIDDTLTEVAGTAPAWAERDHRGVALRSLDDDALPLTYAFVEGMLVIGSGPEHVASIVDAAEDGDGLDRDEGFTSATEGLDAVHALMFMDVPSILQAVRDELPPEDVESFDEEVGRNLDPIGHVVMGMDGDASRQHMRFFVEIR